ALDHVVAEPVEPDFFQQPTRVINELGVNKRRPMTEVGHVAESRAVPGLVLAGMKTFPITWKPAALRRELCPARLSVERICFQLICAAVVIEYEIGIDLESQ